jgi:hypothetical protein
VAHPKHAAIATVKAIGLLAIALDEECGGPKHHDGRRSEHVVFGRLRLRTGRLSCLSKWRSLPAWQPHGLPEFQRIMSEPPSSSFVILFCFGRYLALNVSHMRNKTKLCHMRKWVVRKCQIGQGGRGNGPKTCRRGFQRGRSGASRR